MPSTFLVCGGCGTIAEEENNDTGDIDRDGCKVCGADAMVYVGGYVDSSKKEFLLQDVIEALNHKQPTEELAKALVKFIEEF